MGEKSDKQEYISVGELSIGFSENILPVTDRLVGKEVDLNYESGKKARITFIDREALKWETEDQGRKEQFMVPSHFTWVARFYCSPAFP